MICENQLEPWTVVQVATGNSDYVRFAFECNDVTTHDNEEETEITINSI